VEASTCRGDGSGEVDDEGCYDKSLADVFTASHGVVGGLGTHQKNGQHGCEQVSILVPECVCSEDEETWMNRIRNTHFYGATTCTFRAND